MGDPVGSTLEAADPPRVHRGRAEAERQGQRQRDRARSQQAPLDERDVVELALNRRREQDDARRAGTHGERGLRMMGVSPHDRAGGDAAGHERLSRNRVVVQVGGRPDVRRVVDDAQAATDWSEERHSVRRERSRQVGRVQVRGGLVALRHRSHLTAQPIDLAIDEPVFERGHHGRVHDRERDDDQHEQRETEADADAESHHRSRKRYPTPRTVKMYSGLRGSRSSFSRRCLMCTSIVRGSR